MDAIKFPSGYNQVMPYLILEDADSFQAFMQKIFGAKEKMKVLKDDKTIMHAEIQIGDVVIMFAQCSNEYKPTPGAFFIYVNDADATFNEAIANGATKLQDVVDQDYGRSGGVKDPNGNTWWITSEKK